ncbi:leucyl aminopeptidase [Erythrobacter arachoides]|uniref:Probable cytosol aminopeptidase n=1 Tax=Aurantiacibacter arachoides TaxID=1850444 RepID=A0A845A1R9_9SPHN|nr:leucyl aminopeptidase [Aurantiacibacter arachoides]MXO93654.1 leucyl aminopeptidase [Aurantiacibacter arachoides]GGD47727.1 putative cytosol aminopeptidase [Aurantiacibacter arachoides]
MTPTFRTSSDSETPRLVARVVEQDKLPADLPRAVSEGAAASRFTGKAGQVFDGFHDADGKVQRLALAGAGKNDDARMASLEKAGGALTAKYLVSGETELGFDATGLSAEEVAAVLLGMRLRAWRWDEYRTKLRDEQKPTLKGVVVLNASEGAEAAWQDASALAAGVEFTRELVAEPPNVIYPDSFAERCKDRFADTGAKVRVLDEAEMEALGMGALLGVGQGSARDSRLLVIEWMGGADGDAPIAFVGKGVTFDTGGISLKPGAGMDEMKWDMGGAGAVAGAMLALVMRRAQANIVGVCGLVENMPDGNAIRPGDVLTSMNGQTIEVLNTDAEGRLVLCDALCWTQREYKPARIVDLATLTGAMVIALGSEHAGLFSNNDGLADDLLAAGKASGDKLWRFPLSPEYDKLIDSPIADMKNVGPRPAGSITAAQFLQRFIENDTPWAHLDIAGMAWADKAGATYDKGATGYGVRLLDRLVRDTAER